MTEYLTRTQSALLDESLKQLIGLLKKLIFKQSTQKGWYEIYRATFVLLSSLETVHAREIELLRRFEAKVYIYISGTALFTWDGGLTFCAREVACSHKCARSTGSTSPR
jgi:hypothetical protein